MCDWSQRVVSQHWVTLFLCLTFVYEFGGRSLWPVTWPLHNTIMWFVYKATTSTSKRRKSQIKEMRNEKRNCKRKIQSYKTKCFCCHNHHHRHHYHHHFHCNNQDCDHNWYVEECQDFGITEPHIQCLYVTIVRLTKTVKMYVACACASIHI